MPVRVLAQDYDAGGQRLRLPALLFLLPGLDLAQLFRALIPDGEARQRLVPPVHLHLRGPGPVALCGQQLYKLRLLQPRYYDDRLALLHSGARARDEPGVAFQNSLFHILPHL